MDKRADKVNSIIQVAKNSRALFEPKWYVNYNAYENNHFVVWLPSSKQIKKIPIRGNKFFNQIPEIKQQVDTIQNMLLANEVVPVVYPVNMDSVSTYWAEKVGDYLTYLYKHWYFNGVLHDAVHDALVMPCSFIQLLPPKQNDGKMEILELDATDVFIPPGVKDVQSVECNYIGKSIRRPVSEIKSDPNYGPNRSKIKGSVKYSSSTYKELLMVERYSQSGGSEPETEFSIVDEVWMKEYDKKGKVKISVITVCEGLILRDEETDYDRFPFVSIKLHQGQLYQPSFVEYQLPINRSIDLFTSRLEDMALKMVRGGILAQYGSDITRTTDENGEIVYWKLSKPDLMPMPEVPPFFVNYLQSLYSLSERYGASAVTMGATPKGIKTYRTVEAVRQQDYASQKTSADFLKIAMTQLFNLVIYFASMYYLEPVGVKIYEQENYNCFEVLGHKGLKHNMHLFESAQNNPDPLAAAPVVIHPDNVVEVEFEDASSYTMEGKRQTVFEAVQNGLLSREDAVRMLKLGNVRDIIANLEKQAQNDAQQPPQMGQAAPPGAPGAPVPPPAAPQGSNLPPQGMPIPQPTPPPAGRPGFPGIRVGQ